MPAKTKKAPKTEVADEPVIAAIKGTDKNMQCRGFQFELGKTYEQAGEIECCGNGFHAVTGSPFDAWNHYPIIADDGSLNRYWDVKLSGSTDAKDDKSDSKIAAAKITFDAEIHLPDFIRRAVSWVVGSSGHSARIGSSGNYAQIGSSGDYAQIGSSGHSARIGSSGNYARIVAEGKNSVIACAGSATVTAGEGGAICIPYHNGNRTRFAVGYVGEDGIEAGVAYVARDGKMVRAAS